jgi:CubicO group peptidase (beta-lactamase class C family)
VVALFVMPISAIKNDELHLGGNAIKYVENDLEKDELLSENREYPHDDDLFDMKVKLMMRLTHLPSLAACIIKDNEIVWSNAYGYSDIYHRKEATIDNIYLVASISKTFAATAILQLYEQGYFDLDDNVSEYLPFDVKNPKFPDVNITFRMLLSHRSSFCSRHVESLFAPWEPVDGPESVPEVVEWYIYSLVHLKDLLSSDFYPEDRYPWIKEIMVPGGSLYYPEQWGDYPPGEEFYYSNVAYALLGYLVEQISNQKFEDYCRANIFEPLSMFNTSFYTAELNSDKLAIPYIWLYGAYLPLPNYEYLCQNPAAGLRTTVVDLSHFLIAHMNDGEYNGVQILNKTTIKEMHRVQYPPGNYGLGWLIYSHPTYKIEGHDGNNLGFRSFMFFHSSQGEKVGIIYFYNEQLWGCPIFGFFSQLKDTLLQEGNIWDMFLEKALEL